MRSTGPNLLLVATQSWRNVRRLAERLVQYGAPLSVLCPVASDLGSIERLHSRHTLQGARPLQSLESAIESFEPAYLVPGDDLAVWLLQEFSERSPGYRMLVERSTAPLRSAPIIRSRAGLIALAASLGIPVPECAPARTLAEAQTWSQGRDMPLVLKKDGSWGGLGVVFAFDQATLACGYAELSRKLPLRDRASRMLRRHSRPVTLPRSWIADAEISAQSYVKGQPANAMFACDRGSILGSVQARVVAARGETGPATVIEWLADERIDRAGKLLARSLGLSGFFGLDFILESRSGLPILIEMNPRCTQLGDLADPAGPGGRSDLIALLWSCWSRLPVTSLPGAATPACLMAGAGGLELYTDGGVRSITTSHVHA